MPKKQSGNRRNKQSNFAKLSIFQPNKYKFRKSCPLSVKGAPRIDYKNIKLLNKIGVYILCSGESSRRKKFAHGVMRLLAKFGGSKK